MVTNNKAEDRKVALYLQKAEARNQRARAAQLARIKKAIAGASFLEWELREIERLVFAAFGRTKLGGHPTI
jgi:hypothetical protein